MRGQSTFRQRSARLRLNFLAVLVVLFGTGPAEADPQALFDTNCALCHQKGGVGVRGQFPRLAGRIEAIAATAVGRTYLQQVMLFGMAGKIDVDGQPLIGVMPSFAHLADDDLAALLNYVSRLGSASTAQATPITATELAKTRSSAALSPIQVHASRAAALALIHSKGH